MEVQKAIRKIHKLKAEISNLEFKLEAAQEHIDTIKHRVKAALLIGLFLGGIAGIFWRELWKIIIKIV